jgi:Trk K+ transport system NAD-binding subunit
VVTLGDGTDVFEVAVAADASVVGTPLADAQAAGAIPEQVVLISIERDGRVIQPTDDTVIQADDVVTLIPRDVPESEALDGFLSPEDAE